MPSMEGFNPHSPLKSHVLARNLSHSFLLFLLLVSNAVVKLCRRCPRCQNRNRVVVPHRPRVACRVPRSHCSSPELLVSLRVSLAIRASLSSKLDVRGFLHQVPSMPPVANPCCSLAEVIHAVVVSALAGAVESSSMGAFLFAFSFCVGFML
ncbi:hypothetical protein Syun_004144 [Stephania yunnanensis]|uniref:Uncharacterized protein n=1 Tax=Stephania yunnanensis TaxID=152371 RepID=A0AAP0L2H0_9MAGN